MAPPLRVMRRTVVSTVLLALTLALSFVPATGAAQVVDGNSEPTNSLSEATQLGWSEEQLRSLAASTDATLEQASERVVADVLYEELVAYAMKAYPDSFGGYEIKNIGATALVLFFTRDADRLAAGTVRAAAPGAPRVSARTVERTEEELRALYDAAIARNADLVDREAGERLSSVELDRRNNAVVVAIDVEGRNDADASTESRRSPEDLQQRAAAPEWDGLKIVEESRTVEPVQCVNRDDCRSMRGGISINSQSGRCTMSYTGYNKATNEAVVVTNAHCGRSVANAFYRQGFNSGAGYDIGPRGPTADRVFGEIEPGVPYGYDAVRITDEGPLVGIRPFVYYSAPQAEYPVYAVGSSSLHVEGRSRCFAGRTTSGATDPALCGTSGYGPAVKRYTESDGRTWAMANSYSFNNVCAVLGDSGAPVINPSGNYLDGHVFGNETQFGQCPLFPGTGTNYQLVEHSADALGIRVQLAAYPCSNRPPVTC